MSPEAVALRHYRARRRLVEAVAREARQAWRVVDRADIGRSWLAALGRLLLVVAAAQRSAADASDDYLAEVLAAQGVDPAPAGRVAAGPLSGVASDGRPLSSLLYRPAIGTLTAIRAGVAPARALAGGYAALDMIVRTQVADAGRVADQVALVARRQATGYVRMVVGRTCGRCLVLAGRRYGWSAGFQRHPRLPMRLRPHPCP